jgi:hypothetical protein
MHTCAPEFVRDDCRAPRAQHTLHNREEGRDERLFEHAVAGEDDMRRRLQSVKRSRAWGAGQGGAHAGVGVGQRRPTSAAAP